jgi:hypothetical protein
MSLDYTSLQAWLLDQAKRDDLATQCPGFIRQCESLIRTKVEALEIRTTLTDTDRASDGLYNLSGRVREVRAAYATTSTSGESYPLENVGVSGIRQLRADADPLHYAIAGQQIEFRGVPATGAELELVVIGWPEALATTASNDLLTYHEDVYIYGSLHYLYQFSQDLELAASCLDTFSRVVDELNKATRRRIGGGSVLPWYNFGQIQVSRGR